MRLTALKSAINSSQKITRILLLIITLLFSFHLFSTAARAQTPAPQASLDHSSNQSSPSSSNLIDKGYLTPNFNPDVPRNQHTIIQSVFIEVIATSFCVIIGIDPINPQQGCLGIDRDTQKIGFIKPEENQAVIGGLLGYTPSLFAQVFIPPASSGEYIRYLADNFGITKPAHAQAKPVPNGFDSLRPIQALWITSRNITYMFFVLIFVIIGVGIMLRVKIDPRTVMSLQNQIPRVIISILLITFSYAIVGLMIDLMWLTTYTGINVITQSNGVITNHTDCKGEVRLQGRAHKGLHQTPLAYVSDILQGTYFGTVWIKEPGGPGFLWNNGSVLDYEKLDKTKREYICSGGFTRVAFGTAYALGDLVTELISNLFTGGRGWKDVSCGKSLVSSIFSFVSGSTKEGSLFDCFALLIAGPSGSLANLLTVLIVYCVMFMLLLRLWFELLKAYVMIILYAITGPFWIIMGLLPSKPLGFEKWFRRIFANLIAFPATVALLLASSLFMELFTNHKRAVGETSFVPPLIGNTNVENFGILLGFGVLLIAPGIVKIIKDSMHAVGKQGAAAALTATNSLAAGAAPVKGAGMGTWNKAFHYNPYTGRTGFGYQLIKGNNPQGKWGKTLNWLSNKAIISPAFSNSPPKESPETSTGGH
jgi:hypothetical protein